MPLRLSKQINDMLRFSTISLSVPRQYDEGDLVLLYDQAKEPLGAGKFQPHVARSLCRAMCVRERSLQIGIL
jgi:hypothetical protein